MSRSRQIFLVIVCLCLWVSTAMAGAFRITVLVAEDGGAYSEFASVFANEVAGKKHAWQLQQESTLQQDADFIVAVGGHSCSISVASRLPVLCVLLPKAGFESVLQSSVIKTAKVSAIYLDQPILRRLALIDALFPEKKSLGVMYSTPPSDLPQLRSYVAQKKLTLLEKKVSAELPLSAALQSLVQESEVIVAFSDPVVYNGSTIRNILLSSYRQNVPLIGFSKSYVNAGALAAVFSSPLQMAAQTADTINKYVESSVLPHAQFPNDFEVLVNQQVARSLAIPIKEAADLTKQLKAAELSGGGAK